MNSITMSYTPREGTIRDSTRKCIKNQHKALLDSHVLIVNNLYNQYLGFCNDVWFKFRFCIWGQWLSVYIPYMYEFFKYLAALDRKEGKFASTSQVK